MNAYVIPGLPVKPELIDKLISKAFEIDISWLYTRSRKRIGVEARQFGMWWRDNYTSETQGQIADRYGGRDHATVVHAKKTVENLMKTDKVFRNKAEMAIQKLEYLKM